MMINNETRIVIIKLFIKQIKCSQVEAVDADWDLFPARASRDHSFLYFVVWPLTRQVYIYYIYIYIYEQMKRSWVLPYESRDVGLHQSVCAHAQTHVE
mmetsp:Transcript_27370/g.72238  ORF Transcript_27370/g.72238 Transcript_27370/m.72238 type:complete len:98 (+) Transcript_27370:218-511(+)